MSYEKKIFFVICFFIIILVSLIAINALKNIGREYIEEKEEKEYETKKKLEEEELQYDKYLIDYKANNTIRVKICSTDEIVAMDVNDYLRGVLPAEMPPYYNLEALKAQVVVARTYLYRKLSQNLEGDEYDICDNYAHCQAFYNKEQILEIWEKKGYDENLRKQYWENVNRAVIDTSDEVIMYNGEYIRAYFHASSPLATESSSEIWGKEEIPYLVSVPNQESEDYPNRKSIVEISYENFLIEYKEKINPYSTIKKLDKNDIHINEYTTSGRVKNISICGYIVSAEVLRTVYGLNSTMFDIECEDEKIVFNVLGYGHGLGMSQVGADFLASQGKNYIDIIKYYYTGVDVEKLE